MKQLFISSLALVLLTFTYVNPASAQKVKEEKSNIESLFKSKHFIFKAQTANPMRGNMVQLTSSYDMVISGDTLRTFLPYFGRAYSAPLNSAEGGIKILSSNYNYVISDKRKKRWNITIKPIDNDQVQQMTLSVSEGGYASLRVNSTNRDPITFNGYITAKE